MMNTIARSFDRFLPEYRSKGFAILENCFDDPEINLLLSAISSTEKAGANFRRSNALFAIRQFLKEMPAVAELLFNANFCRIVSAFGDDYAIVKSIYFDKPPAYNWFVAYHQDLTISVGNRTDTPGFGPWSVKGDDFAVQPPLALLEEAFTLRIHLDDTTAGNGALRVIPGSHRRGIFRPESLDRTTETEVCCAVPRGGVMIMSPLLLHASGRSTEARQRRVIHLEFSRAVLPQGLEWAERVDTLIR